MKSRQVKRTRRFSLAAAAAVVAVVTIGALAAAPDPADPQRRAAGAPAAGGAVPFRAPKAGAPQTELDAALYVVEPFFDVSARLARPYAEARPLVAALATKYPSDPLVPLHLARLDLRLGGYDAAAKEMEQYATLAGREPNALRRLAAFYRSRAMAAEEVRTLDELAAKLPAPERGPVYRRAIAAYNDGRPAGVVVDTLYQKLVDADPADGAALRDYVSLLLTSNDEAAAVAALDRAAKANPQPDREFSRLLLAERARIHDRAGRRKEAVDVYERAFDPLWPRAVAADYYALLSRYGLYRDRRRALQQQVSGGAAPIAAVARLFNFYAYEGNLPAAGRLLTGLEATRKGAWPAGDLELAASLYAQIGDFDQASRYVYSLYLQGGFAAGSPDRERVLSRLFTALVSARESATRLAPGGISLYADIARIDPRPGALNGLLSLILAGNNPASEFAIEEARAGGYLNRALAHSIYEQFRKEYPASPLLGAMTVDLVGALADLGADRDVVSVGTEFMKRFPDSREYEAVALAVADAHVQLKARAAERAVIQGLLDRLAARQPSNRPLLDRSTSRWIYRPDSAASSDDEEEGESTETGPDVYVAPNGTPVEREDAERFVDTGEPASDDFEPTQGGSSSSGDSSREPDNYRGETDSAVARPTYAQLLERMVSSFESDEQQPGALAFFWGEVKKHPKDEGLMERFLAWLGGTSLINDQIRAYRTALERYDDGTWLHRFARWHVRNGRGAEIRRLTEQVIRTLDDESVAAYLQEFAGYGGTAKGDSLDWDNEVALQVARLAHTRFPNDVTFVKTMLDRLASAEEWTEWERLSREYYFGDAAIRENYLQRLSQTTKLAGVYAAARERATGGLEGGATSAFAYAVLAADSARWLSRYDEALGAYRRLVELYPGETAYATPLADLTRSFGSRDPKFYLEASKVLDDLAARYPSERSYATKSGEALAEAGDMGEASKRWAGLVRTAPGSPAVRLEVATIYWDYYQFDDAAAQLVAVRTQTRDDALYAFRLGAIYDSKRDLKLAIPEYVKTLGEPGDERDRAKLRLAELSRRDGVLAQVASAYDARRKADPAGWQLTVGYADFLRWIDRTGEAVGVLNREAAASHDVAFLEEARDRFRQWRSTESEERALRRLVDESRDERERIRARLQLAAFLDQQGRSGDAVSVFDQLVADNPTNAGVLEEATRYYARSGNLDKSVALSRTVIAKAQGDYKKRFVTELARRQADAGRLGDAEATLRAYFDENALDMDVFGALAKVLGDAKREQDLATLYATALKRVREANLADDEERDRVASLRTGMIRSLTALGRTQEAVDQHIEIVNRDAENVQALDTAYDYAARYDLVPRLVAYYEKLAKDSYKDYRWSLVLGRLYDRTGNAAGAAEALRRAVTNEPQRVDLRSDLSDALVRAGRDEDAVAELRRAWEIDGRDPQWLVSVARIRVRQGRLDDASKTIDEALAARKTLSADRLFTYGDTVAGWGLLDKSTDLYERGIEAARQKPTEYYVSAERVGKYIGVAARVRPAAELFARLEAQRLGFEKAAAAPDNYSSSSARYIARGFDEAERNAFGQAVAEYASAQERTALDAALRSAAASAADPDDKRRYLGIAQTAGLGATEEAIELQIVDATLAVYKESGTAFRSALTEMADMYTRRAWYARAAQQLTAYRARDKQPGDYDYDRRIAQAYRLAGDTANEIGALERLYAVSSGDRVLGANEASVAVGRLFELLVATNQRDRLVALASTQSPYQFQLINFLIERGDEELARRAIVGANVSPVWVKAQTAEVGLFFRNSSPEIESAFRDALRARPIGELVAQKFDPKTMLTGSDYFLTARNYGLWLDLVANRPDAARDYVVGRVEERPRDAGAQAQLARFYLARDNAKLAMTHVDLAAELAPTDRNVVAVRGEVLDALGRKDEAVAEWTKLVKAEGAGSEDYRLYFLEMSSYGHFDRALGDLRQTIADRIYVGKYGEISDLVGDIADYGKAHPEAWPAVSDALYGIAVDATDDVLLLRNVLSNDLVPEDRRAPFYRLLTDRLEGIAAAAAANPDGEGGVYLGEDDYVYPAEELASWRKLAVDYLITHNAAAEATKLLDAIEAERVDSGGGLAGDGSDDYSWVELARAALLLRSNHKPEALEALERYCAPRGEDGAPSLPDRSRCLAAVAILQANGAEPEADAMLESAYRRLIDARQYDPANFTGLAEVLYRRGRTDEADATLRGLAARNPDDAGVLETASDAAARAGRYPAAIELREAAARVARADARNALELARLRAATGDAAKAASGYADLAADERAPNSVRAQAVDLAVELAAKDSGAKSALAARLGSPKSDPERVLAALLSGSPRPVLEPLAAAGSALAAVELGRVELAAGQRAAAIAAFEKALSADERGTLAEQIAFGGATPAESLVELYGAANRPEAALEIGTARATVFQTDDGETATELVFEPDVREVAGPTGLASLWARNADALRVERATALAALAEAAAKLGRYDEAVGYARRRVTLSPEAQERAKAETRVNELLAAKRESERRSSGLLRVGAAIATDSVAIREFTLD